MMRCPVNDLFSTHLLFMSMATEKRPEEAITMIIYHYLKLEYPIQSAITKCFFLNNLLIQCFKNSPMIYNNFS